VSNTQVIKEVELTEIYRLLFLGLGLRLGLRDKVGGAVALWLVRSAMDRAVHVRALVKDIVLCFWARHFYSHSASLHKGVHMGTGEFNRGGNSVIN